MKVFPFRANERIHRSSRGISQLLSLAVLLGPGPVWGGSAVFAIAALLSLDEPALAQTFSSVRAPGVGVIEVAEDLSRGEILLKTEGRVIAGRPQFKYLPGDKGDTVLVADFGGLSWNRSTRIIRVGSSKSGSDESGFAGIKEIHIGQFQDSPSILRLSFIARDPAILKKVAIGAAPGVLKISMAGRSTVASVESKKSSRREADVSPALSAEKLPTAELKDDREDKSRESSRVGWLSKLKSRTHEFFSGESPNADTSRSEKITTTEKDESSNIAERQGAPVERRGAPVERQGSQVLNSGNSPIGFAPPIAAKNQALTSEAGTTDGAPLGPVPLVTLEKADDQGSGAKLEIFRVELAESKPLVYKSFRLHNPERYVMDVSECPQLASSALPDISQSPLVSSIRVGVPGENGAGRLVLQLVDNSVSVDESFNSGSSYITVTLGKGLGGTGIGLNRTNLGGAASIVGGAAGPIYVPRAPSETVIVLDAGHGGSDPGAMRGDVQEKEITMAIINKLKKVLEGKGARIVLTRSDDTFVSLEDRVRITNQVQPNLFLSVHINSLESTSDIYGVETYYQTDRSRPLADKVHESLVSGLGVPDRFVRKARFYVINHTPVPAILAEVGYITNKTERDRLISSDYQSRIAGALARGVMLYLQDTKSQSELAGGSQSPSRLATSGSARTK